MFAACEFLLGYGRRHKESHAVIEDERQIFLFAKPLCGSQTLELQLALFVVITFVHEHIYFLC